jgi:hypothetical protein
MQKRTLNIREVDNGYIVRCEVDTPPSNTAVLGQFTTTELVVTSLPQLLKKVKTFMESEIVDSTT